MQKPTTNSNRMLLVIGFCEERIGYCLEPQVTINISLLNNLEFYFILTLRYYK